MTRLLWLLLLVAVPAYGQDVIVHDATPSGDPQSLICDGVIGTPTGWNSAPTDCTAIDDDPESPGGDWIFPASGTADPVLRVSFGTPSTSPTGTQTFDVYLAKCDDSTCSGPSGGGTPTIAIDVYETSDGTPDASCGAQNITAVYSSGEVLSCNWDASVLETADGSAVEMEITCTSDGGGPNARTCVVDAVEWDKN